ncbi:hypothetical protein QTP88_003545 [Uroleucon formosanum]
MHRLHCPCAGPVPNSANSGTDFNLSRKDVNMSVDFSNDDNDDVNYEFNILEKQETDVLPNSANSGTDFNLSRKDVNMSVNVSNNDDDINYEFNILEKQGISSFYYFYLFYFEENIQNIKKWIMSYGPCRPKITCWVFANCHYSYFQKAWINGVNDWPNLTNKITTHEKSLQHIEASKTRALWKQNETIDKISERQYSEEALFWRNVLERIIKIILFLTAGNTALRGHEHKQKCNSEHFDGEVRLLAEYDSIINQLLNDEKKKVKYFSWKVQNEVIELLVTNIRNHICDEIRISQCFSIIMDSTQGIVKLDQVSVVIRYVVINYDDLDISIKESFLGFFKIDKHGAQDYEELISEILLMFKIDINKCRGQGYDGASVMSGVCSGVQKRIKDKRQKFAVKHFDEVEGDRRLSISDENFGVKIVLPVIDMVLFQLNLRFEGLRKVTENFDFLFPTSLIALSDNDLAKASMDFFQLYQSDISSDFTRQLLCIKDQLIPQKIKSIKELTLYIIKINLCRTFFDVLSACIIYLTLPVTVASAERSFSKLKLIKNYLRNNMGQDRLSNIAVLNIEKDVAAKFKLDHVINTFANSKARKGVEVKFLANSISG